MTARGRSRQFALRAVAFFRQRPEAALYAGRLLASPRHDRRRPAVLVGLLLGLVLFNLDAGVPGEAYPEEEAGH